MHIPFQRKTIETYKQRSTRQNKARRKRLSNVRENEDDIGLNGMTLILGLLCFITVITMNNIIASSIKWVHKSKKNPDPDPWCDSDFENKENRKRKPQRYVLLYIIMTKVKKITRHKFFSKKAKEKQKPTKGRNDPWPLKLHCWNYICP